MVRSGSQSIVEVSERLGLGEKSVRLWVTQAEVDAQGGTPSQLATEEREELSRLRRELKRVTMERDVLKKATAFFAAQDKS